jgi:hypothetical protein
VPNLSITGTLVEGPASAQDGQFPAATVQTPFALNTGANAKPVAVSTGMKLRNINSPNAFVALSGVGLTDDVTQAHTVYMRVAAGGFQFRVTFHNPVGADIVSVLPAGGLFIFEPDANGGYYVKLLEVQGAGQIEVYAAGAI